MAGDEKRDLRAEMEMIDDAGICESLGISNWTLREWRRKLNFPRPIFVTDGSPGRTPVARVLRWLDSRERRRRRVVPRGRLKRGNELVDGNGD